jgi:hypothetical protein
MRTIIYEELPAQLVYIKFKLSGKNEFITVATTRPELICSCQAILVHPEDERYKNLIGQKAILPIYEREVAILSNRVVGQKFWLRDSYDLQLWRYNRCEIIQRAWPEGDNGNWFRWKNERKSWQICWA